MNRRALFQCLIGFLIGGWLSDAHVVHDQPPAFGTERVGTDAQVLEEEVELAARAQTPRERTEAPFAAWMAFFLIILVLISVISNAFGRHSKGQIWSLTERHVTAIDNLFLEFDFLRELSPNRSKAKYLNKGPRKLDRQSGFMRHLDLHRARFLSPVPMDRGDRLQILISTLQNFPTKDAAIDATVHTCYPYGRDEQWFQVGIRFNAFYNTSEADLRLYIDTLKHHGSSRPDPPSDSGPIVISTT